MDIKALATFATEHPRWNSYVWYASRRMTPTGRELSSRRASGSADLDRVPPAAQLITRAVSAQKATRPPSALMSIAHSAQSK